MDKYPSIHFPWNTQKGNICVCVCGFLPLIVLQHQSHILCSHLGEEACGWGDLLLNDRVEDGHQPVKRESLGSHQMAAATLFGL